MVIVKPFYESKDWLPLLHDMRTCGDDRTPFAIAADWLQENEYNYLDANKMVGYYSDLFNYSHDLDDNLTIHLPVGISFQMLPTMKESLFEVPWRFALSPDFYERSILFVVDSMDFVLSINDEEMAMELTIQNKNPSMFGVLMPSPVEITKNPGYSGSTLISRHLLENSYLDRRGAIQESSRQLLQDLLFNYAKLYTFELMDLINLQTYNSPNEVFLGPSTVKMLQTGFDNIIPQILQGVFIREVNDQRR